jgi:hypothetical protein
VKKVDELEVERIAIDISLATGKRLDALGVNDFKAHALGAALLNKNAGSATDICARVAQRLKQKIEAGTAPYRDVTFLHTEPHHDDLILGCMPLIVRHIREHSTRHVFTTFTSGFTAVTNAFMLRQLMKLRDFVGLGCLRRVGCVRLLRSIGCRVSKRRRVALSRRRRGRFALRPGRRRNATALQESARAVRFRRSPPDPRSHR